MEKYYIATLSAVNRIGHQSVKKLIKVFGSAENVWRADLSELITFGINQKAAENLIEFRSQHPDAVEKLVTFCNLKKVKICTFYDEEFPPILKEISGAPALFYYRGELQTNAERVSIVGTREPTVYGERIARMLGNEFAAAGLTVVSGAARGIDTFAQKAALKVGRTVSVLGYGINKIPREKRNFFEEIIENGGVIMTEFPPNFDGTVGTFPARNRIIAGLSRSVIIVEAGEKSGALITADYAADNSREVFVIPHDVFSKKGVGCNKLIRDGATLITCAADVLDSDCYNLDNNKSILRKVMQKIETENKEKAAPKAELDATEKLIFDAIPENDSITLEEILEIVDEIEPNEISEIMLRLEMKGYVSEKDDKYSRL